MADNKNHADNSPIDGHTPKSAEWFVHDPYSLRGFAEPESCLPSTTANLGSEARRPRLSGMGGGGGALESRTGSLSSAASSSSSNLLQCSDADWVCNPGRVVDFAVMGPQASLPFSRASGLKRPSQNMNAHPGPTTTPPASVAVSHWDQLEPARPSLQESVSYEGGPLPMPQFSPLPSLLDTNLASLYPLTALAGAAALPSVEVLQALMAVGSQNGPFAGPNPYLPSLFASQPVLSQDATQGFGTPLDPTSPSSPSHPYADGSVCDHVQHWKRLRIKRGLGHFLCCQCGAKWRAPSQHDYPSNNNSNSAHSSSYRNAQTRS